MEKLDREDFYKIYMVKKNFQIPLALDRGFDLSQDDLEYLREDFTFKDFMEMFDNETNIENLYRNCQEIYTSKNPRTQILPDDKTGRRRKLLAYFLYETSLNISITNLGLFIDKLQDFEYSEVVLFANKPLKKNEHEMIKNLYPRVDFFSIDASICNPTKHALANRCERVADEERNEIVAELAKSGIIKNINNKIPKMNVNDVTVMYYGWNKNDLIRIYREMQTDSIADMKMEYRIVWG